MRRLEGSEKEPAANGFYSLPVEGMQTDHPGPEPASKPASGSAAPKKMSFQVVAVQGISCAVVLLLVLLLRLVGGDTFAQLRKQFNDSIMNNSLMATLAALMESPEETPPDASPDASSPGTTPDASSDVPSQTPGDPSTSTPASTPSSAPTGGDAASTGTGSSPPTNPSSPDKQTVRYAPSGASFAAPKGTRLAVGPLEEGTISSVYGYRQDPLAEGEEFHKGIDIAAPTGEPVRAMYFGVVTEVGNSPSYGLYVRLYHGNGLEILYAHCSEILVEKGAVVRAGESVSRVGATGNVTGSHLHVEACVDGVVYNPIGLIGAEQYA